MGKKKTPLIQKLRQSGGTLYIFPSAQEDVGLNLQSTTTGCAISHYALLNLPKMSISKCLCESGHTAKDGNEALAMSLQNYMMNFETHLTNREDYNYQELATVSEKAFWHWLKRLEIIKKDNFSNEKTGFDNIYIESGNDNDSQIPDSTLVKCFGAVDAGNTLSTEFGMYNETYINIPTSYGAGPVFFECLSDSNIRLGGKYKVEDKTHLEGRDDEYVYYSYTAGQDTPYFDDIENGRYDIDETFDCISIVKDINRIQTIARNQYNNKNIVLGSYDDINVDTNNYFNVDEEFEFNAILLYYSVYDQDDLIKTAYATNLFGIIFLDGTNMENSNDVDSFYIPTCTKRKSTTSKFGNSFSFRVNLKTMAVYDNTDAIIQDNTTMSSIASVDFSDAISNLNVAIDTLNNNTVVIQNIQDKYAKIISYYDNLEEKIQDISTSLNAYLRGTRSSYVDTSLLYVNNIYTTKSGNNIIKVFTKSSIPDETGNVQYNDNAVLTVNQENIDIPVLSSSTTYSKKNYIVIDNKSGKDIQIYKDNNPEYTTSNLVAQDIDKTLDNMFTQYNNLVIKVKNEGLQDDYRSLYIDADSKIFDRGNKNIWELRDTSGNINYIEFIPYILLELQRLAHYHNK